MDPYRAEKDDVATERVLCALNAVQPAPGFEDRLLQQLARQSQQTRPPALRLGLAARGVLAGAGCTLAVLVVLFSVHFWPRHLASSGRIKVVPLRASASAPTSAAQSGLRPEDQPRVAKLRGPLNPTPAATSVHARLEVASSSEQLGSTHSSDTAEAQDLDRQAFDDLHAESTPPPPLPLTAQERMVKLMLRRGEKHELAQLDPAQGVRLTDAERRSFQSFFDPEPSPELALELKKGNLR